MGRWFLFLLTLAWGGAALGQSNIVLYEQHLNPYPVSILLPIRIGTNTYSFLLDSGSSGNVYDPSLKSAVGPLIGHAKTFTPAGRIDLPIYEGPPLGLGKGYIPALPTGVKDMSPVINATGYNIRGILGAKAFKAAALSLDFDGQKLKFIKHAAPRGMESLDMEFGPDGVTPCLLVNLDGKVVRFVIDLGFNGAVGLSKDTYASCLSMGVIKELSGHNDLSVTFGGNMKNHTARFVKGMLLGTPLAGFTTSSKGEFNLVGLAFLVNYNVVMDLQHAKFYYKPRRPEPILSVSDMFGAIINYDNGYAVVGKMRPGPGPVRDIGLQEGDRITRLDDLRRGQFNMTTLYELALEHAGDSVKVEALHKGKPVSGRIELSRKIRIMP